jgi:hypothetical protein
MGFFLDAVLGDSHSIGARSHRAVRPQREQGRRRHVLELGGDGGAALKKLRQALLVQVVGLDVESGSPARPGWPGPDRARR